MVFSGTNTGTSLRRICMNLASRSLYRTGLLVTLAAAVFTFGCAKKKVAPPPPPPPPPPAAARPTVTLQASPSSVNKGESATLSWNSTDATQLTIAPEVGAVTAQGTTKVTPSDSTSYTITATAPAATGALGRRTLPGRSPRCLFRLRQGRPSSRCSRRALQDRGFPEKLSALQGNHRRPL